MPELKTEILTAVQFQDELRRAARLDGRCGAEDPLAAAVLQIQTNPMFAQSRLLARILDALTHAHGEFRRAELAAFDTRTRGVVIALMDLARAGTVSPIKWEEAVSAAHQAQATAAN